METPGVFECLCESGLSDPVENEGFLTCRGCGLVATGVQIFDYEQRAQRDDKEFGGKVAIKTFSAATWDTALAVTPPSRFRVAWRPIKIQAGASWLGTFRAAASVCLEKVQMLLGRKPDVSREMIASAVAHVDRIYVQQVQEKRGATRRRHSMANPVAAATALVLHRWQINIARNFPYARARDVLSLGALDLPWASVVHAADDFAPEERVWLLGFIARCRAAEGELGLRAGATYFPMWQIFVPAPEFAAGGELDSALARKLTASESRHCSSPPSYIFPFSPSLSAYAHPHRVETDFLDA